MSVVSRVSTLPSKLFFRIGEVASLVGVEPHVLRYWEREFRSIRPMKSAKGQRVYSRKDVENLLRVRDLLYRDGFTIAGAKKRLQRSPAEFAADNASTQDASAFPSERETERDLGETYALASVAGEHAFETESAPRFAAEKIPSRVLEPLRTLAAVSSSDPREREREARSTLQIAPRVDAVVMEKLSALRAEVEAFLDELDSGG